MRGAMEPELPDGERVDLVDAEGCDGAMAARYWITFLVFSVLPAPDSPLSDARTSVIRNNGALTPTTTHVIRTL